MSDSVTDPIAQRLRTLRDIEGVLASFLIGERGELVGRDVPAACGSDVLQVVGGRLHKLCDAFLSADVGGAIESTTLYYRQHKLHVRALGHAFLIAVASADVNLPALKMAINMLSRQLLADLASHHTERTSEVHARPSQPPEPTVRSYRGRPVSS